MKFRWLIVCNEYGNKTTPELQYWDIELEEWVSIPTITCKANKVSDAMQNEYYM
jgi:hypothetical protein